MEPHQQHGNQVAVQFKTSSTIGLSSQQAEVRIQLNGLNALPEKKGRTRLSFFVITVPRLIVLLILCIVLFFTAIIDIQILLVLMGIALLNSFVWTVYACKTYACIRALKRFICTDSLVVRDGSEQRINSIYCVPGDLIILHAGQQVPADARIIESSNLQCDETAIMGRSMVCKNEDAVEDEAKFIDRTNMVYKGSYVIAGSGKAIAVATGHNTVTAQAPPKEEKHTVPRFFVTVQNRYFYRLLCAFVFASALLGGRAFAFNIPFAQTAFILLLLCFCIVVSWGYVLSYVAARGIVTMSNNNVVLKDIALLETLAGIDVIMIDLLSHNTDDEFFQLHAMVENAHKSKVRVIIVACIGHESAIGMAKQLGLYSHQNQLLSGQELKEITDEELVRQLNMINVYHNLVPMQKIRIIKMLQRLGKKIAYIGHDIEDEPVLKTANIGVAVAEHSSHAAQRVAGLIVLENSVGLLPLAVKTTGQILVTMRRVLGYFFVNALAQVILVLSGVILDLPDPIVVIWILILNSVIHMGVLLWMVFRHKVSVKQAYV